MNWTSFPCLSLPWDTFKAYHYNVLLAFSRKHFSWLRGMLSIGCRVHSISATTSQLHSPSLLCPIHSGGGWELPTQSAHPPSPPPSRTFSCVTCFPDTSLIAFPVTSCRPEYSAERIRYWNPLVLLSLVPRFNMGALGLQKYMAEYYQKPKTQNTITLTLLKRTFPKWNFTHDVNILHSAARDVCDKYHVWFCLFSSALLWIEY